MKLLWVALLTLMIAGSATAGSAFSSPASLLAVFVAVIVVMLAGIGYCCWRARVQQVQARQPNKRTVPAFSTSSLQTSKAGHQSESRGKSRPSFSATIEESNSHIKTLGSPRSTSKSFSPAPNTCPVGVRNSGTHAIVLIVSTSPPKPLRNTADSFPTSPVTTTTSLPPLSPQHQRQHELNNAEQPKLVVTFPSIPISLGHEPAWWNKSMRERLTANEPQLGTDAETSTKEDKPLDSLSLSNPPAAFQKSSSQDSATMWADQAGVGLKKNLAGLLSHPAGLEMFRKFLSKSMSCENLMFWEAVDEARKNPTEEFLNNIFNDFVAESADGMINISGVTSTAIAENIAMMNQTHVIPESLMDNLEKAQKEIYSLLEKDLFPKFIASSDSKEWRELWCKLASPVVLSTSLVA